MEAKTYLKQLYRLDELIKSSQEELETQRQLFKRVLGKDYLEDIPEDKKIIKEKKFNEIVSRSIELEKMIMEDITRMLDLKLEIRGVITALENPEERLLLYDRYINFYTWEEICDKMHVSMRTIQRLHASALNKVKIPS